MAGRLIQDNILIAHEAFHFFRYRKNSLRADCIMGMGMEKAYDGIEWDFILSAMEKLGSNPKWKSWIKECISFVTYSSLVNGKPLPLIHPSRCLWQGDPLSPYLFIITTNILSRNIKRAAQYGRIMGLRMKRQCPITPNVLRGRLHFLHSRNSLERKQAKRVHWCLLRSVESKN